MNRSEFRKALRLELPRSNPTTLARIERLARDAFGPRAPAADLVAEDRAVEAEIAEARRKLMAETFANARRIGFEVKDPPTYLSRADQLAWRRARWARLDAAKNSPTPRSTNTKESNS